VSGNSWCFGSVDWSEFHEGLDTSSTAIGNGSAAFSLYPHTVPSAGYNGLNVVTLSTPQTAYFGETTIMSGSVPRALAGGSAFPVGFPFLGGPSVRFTAPAGGALAAGQYGVTAVWKYIDSRGQVHRSAPAPEVITSGGTGVTVNSQWSIEAT